MTEELVEPLTSREEDVLELLRRGFTNAQLAGELGISENTAKDHVSSILRKLGARSRDEAAYWPQQAPWWARVPLIAPVALFLRRIGRRLPGSPSMAATVLAGAALIVVVAGLSLLALLLLRTPGGEEAPQGRWLSLLALIPDTERSRREVTMNDYVQVRALFDIAQPAEGYDEDALADYITAFYTATRGTWPARLLVDSNRIPSALMDLHTELGFTIADADFDIFAGGSLLATDVEPGNQEPIYQVVRGRMSEQSVQEAMRTDPSFSDLLEEASHGGVDYFHWGYEGVDVTRATSVRPLGQGRQLAIRDDAVFWTKFVEDMEDMIDASRNKQSSLADSEDYQLVANALDALGTFSASLSSDTSLLVAAMWEERDATIDDLVPELALAPYTLVATGRGLDSTGPFTAVVLAHDDADGAAENVVRLRERIDAAGQMFSDERNVGDPIPRWSEQIDSAEIVQNGRLLTAKLYDTEGNLSNFRFVPFDTLLIHE